MDIDSDYTVDLLNSIEFVSMENNELEAELKKIEEEIKLLEKEKLKYKSSGIKAVLNEELPNIPTMNLKEFVKQETNDNIKEVNITFTPFDNFKTVFICADFTKWEKRQMNNIGGNTFSANFKLLKGYRYFYNFHADGQKICDFNKDSIDNEYRNKELSNFVIVDSNSVRFESSDINSNINSSINDFSSNLDFNLSLLEQTIKQGEIYVPLIPENILLEKMLDYSVNYNTRESIINNKKDETLGKISNFYDNKIRYINDFFKDKNEEVLALFKNRIIKLNENMYLIQDLLFKEAAFMALKLYDINGIKIQNNSKFGMKSLERVLFKNVYENGNILSLEDSSSVMLEHENNSEVLKIFYQAIQITNFNEHNGYDNDNYYSDENDNAEDDNLGYSKYSKSNNNEFEIVPYKIEPDGVDINDYNLVIEGNKIISVKTRDTGHLVNFEAILINTKDRKLSGFVSTSKLKLYTNLYSKDIVNVIHIHLNDTSNEIAVDSVFLEKDQFPEDFKDFKTDIMGKKLNYKFIFKDLKLNKIYYNLADNYIDEPGFEEIRISAGSMVKINSDKTFKNFYGLVKHIPIGMLVRKDKEKEDILQKMHSEAHIKEGSCFERHLNELPGFVEIELQYDSEKNTLESDDVRENLVNTLTKKNSNNFICDNKKIRISIPICQLSNVSIKEQGEFERLKIKNQMKLNENLKTELLQNYKTIKNYEKYINDQSLMLKELEDVKNTKEILEIVEKVRVEYKISMDYEDENEINSMIEYITENKSKITSLLQQQLRILSLRGKK